MSKLRSHTDLEAFHGHDIEIQPGSVEDHFSELLIRSINIVDGVEAGTKISRNFMLRTLVIVSVGNTC